MSNTKVITFEVTIPYESVEDDGVIDEESMRDNLSEAIENERLNGALSTDDISVGGAVVNIKHVEQD